MISRPSAAPRVLRRVAPDRIEISEGGGCVSLFGLPFFAAGVFVTLIGLRVVPVSNASEVPGWAWNVLIAMGLVFVGVGGALLFGRRWVTLDRANGWLREQRGLLVPMDRRVRGLHEFDRVVLRFEAGDSDTADRYPVALRSAAVGDEFVLHSATDFGESYATATEIATFLRLPLEDRTTGTATIKEPGEINESLQARLRSGRERVEPPFRPRSARSQVREGSGRASIAIPAEPVRLASLLPALVPAGLVAWFGPDVLDFFRETRTPPFVQYVFVGFALLFFVVPALLGVLSRLRRAARGGTFVELTPDRLAIEERGAWRSSNTVIPTAEILDVVAATAQRQRAELQSAVAARAAQAGDTQGRRYRNGEEPRWLAWLKRFAKSDGVRIKALTGIHAFGAGLPDEEVVYLSAVIRRALAGRP
jgi:hypothetical protein